MNKKLSWSKTPPKIGNEYYWLCRAGECSIVYVHVPQDFPCKKGDEYYGPIPVPPSGV